MDTNRGRFVRATLLLLVVFLVALGAMTASADSQAIDFETYTVGNINGQDGWMKTGGFDVAVVDQASLGLAYAGFGARSLRISNGVTSGSFGDQTFSKPLVDEAGETSAANDGMSGGTRQVYYEAEFDFASAVPTAEQAGLWVGISPDRGDGARMSLIRLYDLPAGLAVGFYDYDPTRPGTCVDGLDFVETIVASGLDRTAVHNVEIEMYFVDGVNNDVVNMEVDGALVYTGKSWEDYFRDCEGNPTRTVDSLLFRASGTAVPANTGFGFLIDNFSQMSGPVTQCTTVCYADVVNGNDAFGGTSPADAKKTIQAAVNTVTAGGQVNVLPGTYPESPVLNKSLTLVSTGGRDVTTIDLQTGPTYLGSMTIDGADVTVDGFTVEGFDAVGAGLAATNVWISPNPDNVVLSNNRFLVGQVGVGSNGDDGMGILTTYTTSSDVASVVVENNEFMPLGASASRAFYVNPGVNVFEFRGNAITGAFTASALTQAKDGLVEDNTLTGNGVSRGFATWGYPDPTVYGATMFRGNTISDVVNAITINGSENVTVTKNFFTGNDRAVYLFDTGAIDMTTIHINRNSIDGNDLGVDNGYTDDVDATCNWWGAADGPGAVGPGSGDTVDSDVVFTPWLTDDNLDGLCAAGVFMSATVPGMTGDGLAFGAEDIIKWDGAAWSMWFDGSAAGLEPVGKWKHNLNAIYIPDPALPDVIVSFTQNARFVPGILPAKVDGMDLVKWDGANWTVYFDGTDVGLTNKTQEKIDGLHVLPGSESPIGAGCTAYLLVSTQGPGKVPNYSGGQIKFGGEDVLGFCATNLGDDTTGLWHMVLDGSAQGMPKNATDSISLSADGNTLYLTTKKTFNVDAASGGHSMVYAYDMTTEMFSGPVFDAPANGLPKQVDALEIVELP